MKRASSGLKYWRYSWLAGIFTALLGMATGAQAFTTVQAPNFSNKPAGEPGPNGTWLLYAEGRIEQTLNFPSSGQYQFDIQASGLFIAGDGSRMDCASTA